jgi:hypothetical protein
MLDNALDKTGVTRLWAKVKALIGNGSKTYFATCDTAAATQAKVAVCEGFVLEKGCAVNVQFTYGQTYNGEPTLNVGGTGAIAIKRGSATTGIRYQWSAYEVVQLVYNGTYWVEVNGQIATTTYYGPTKLSTSLASTSTSLAATASAAKALNDKIVAIGIESSLLATDVSIATSAWESDSTFSDYPYKAAAAVSGITADWMCTAVTPDHTNADLQYILGPYLETGADLVYVWASEKPTATIKFDNMTFTKYL